MIIFLSFLIWAEDIYSPQWKVIQQEYRQRILNLPEVKQKNDFPIAIRQIEINDLNHTDRCITCHLNMGNGVNDSLPPPYQSHPGGMLLIHDLQNVSCTFCHHGNGRSLRKTETCPEQHPPNWRPVASYCAACHLAVFDPFHTYEQFPRLLQGLKIFQQNGCKGCHRTRRVGGPYGPDLSQLGEKIVQGYDFKHIVGAKSIINWHREHFKNPGRISPGSIMPDFDLSEENIRSLTILLLGFIQPSLPLQYYDLAVIEEIKNKRQQIDRKTLFDHFCAGCHLSSGKGRPYKESVFGAAALANPQFQSVASLDLISFLIHEGRGNRYMPAWKIRHSGLYRQELLDLIQQIRSWRADPAAYQQVQQRQGDRDKGEKSYLTLCAACHGRNLAGDIGPSLNNAAFQQYATDHFIYQTLVHGRANTAMPSWSTLNAETLAGLIRFLIPAENKLSREDQGISADGDFMTGQAIFHYNCKRCHGSTGMGDIGPAILNNDFIRTADQIYILATLRLGHDQTPMYPFNDEKHNFNDLLAFMNVMADSVPAFIDPGPSLGNPQAGKILYLKNCAKCHGRSGEGIEAPALNNQEFLNAASNGYLLATITIGRSATPMPAWGYESADAEVLSGRERHHLAAFIRQWQTLTIKRQKDNPIFDLLH